MIDKTVPSLEVAVQGLEDGMVVMVGGFGDSGTPHELLNAVLGRGCKDLTIVSNNAGDGDRGIAALILHHRVRKVICSFPTTAHNYAVREAVERGEVELELRPQGTLAECIRAGGAGLGGVLTPTGLGTELAEGKPVIELDGRQYLVERPLRADFALVRGWRADRWGNVVYRYAQQNFNPLMAMAARCTVVQVDHVHEVGEIDPMQVHTPGIFVDRVVRVEREVRA
jgi:3-oxoadipate CoA-transferase alpha subunit